MNRTILSRTLKKCHKYWLPKIRIQSVRPLSPPPRYFSFPPTNGPLTYFLTPISPVLGQFFISRNHGRKYEAGKKGFFPVILRRAVRGQGHGQRLLMSCPGLLKTTLLENCIKTQIKKCGNFEKNVKFQPNFRKCKFKEIKKLNSYVTTYVQKSTPPPRKYSPP